MSTPGESPPVRNSQPPDSQTQDENKPRLTEEQKRQNHISSEQKRRQAIRDGFDKLASLVPGLEGLGRSEGLVLNRTVEHILQQVEERRKLVTQLESKGVMVDDSYKKVLRIDLSKVNTEYLESIPDKSRAINGSNFNGSSSSGT